MNQWPQMNLSLHRNIKTEQMKKNILMLACLATVLVACQKDDNLPSESTKIDALKETTNNTEVSKTAFVKKVLVEEFVGTSYGDAPEFISMLDYVIGLNPGKIIKALHHNNDILESAQTDALVAMMSPNGYMAYPTSLIDRASVNGFRFVGSSNSKSVINQQLNKPAGCGISISSTIRGNNKVYVDVDETFIAAPNTNCNVTVYLVEDKVVPSGSNNLQANNFNNNPKSKFYNKGNPMLVYSHENVVRKCLTPAMGLPIKPGAITSGGSDHQSFLFELSSNINPANCYIIAFVSNYTNGTSAEVMNAQQAKLGTDATMN